MPVLLFLLLMPLLAFAQISFDPVQVDHERLTSFFYPCIYEDSGALRCVWGAGADTVVGAFSRLVDLNGQPTTPTEHWEDATNVCVPSTRVARGEGGEARLFYHS